MKKAPKAVLLSVGGVVAFVLLCFVVAQLALTPRVATSLVNRYAGRFIDADLECGKVGASVFRHFPDLTLDLEDVSLTYPHERFDSLEGASRLMSRGRGETADTLAGFDRFIVAVNLPKLLSGSISVPVISLEHPRVFAKAYNDSTYNWNVFKLSGTEEDPADTSSSALPPVSLHRLRITDNANIVYCSPKDSIFASLRLRRVLLKGDISLDDPASSHGRLRLDTLGVFARTASDTLSFRLGNLRIGGSRDSLGIRADATASARTNLYGRLRVPVILDAKLAFPASDVPTLRLHRFNLSFGGIPLYADGEMTLPSADAPLSLALRAGIDSCDVDSVIDRYVVNFWPDAVSFKSHIMLCAGFAAGTDSCGRLSVSTDNFSVNADCLRLGLNGEVNDILGADPSFSVDASLYANTDSLMRFLPDTLGISASGLIDACIKASARMSQLTAAQIANADINASLHSDSLRFEMPADTLSAYICGLTASAATAGAKGGRVLAKDERILTLKAGIDSVKASISDMYVRGRGLEVKAMNSADILDAASTNAVHPFLGTVSAASLAMRDAEGTAIFVRDNRESFSIRPYKGDRSIPVLSVRSKTGRAFLRMPEGRFSVRDLGLSVSASKVAYHKRHNGASARKGTSAGRPEGQGRRERPEWLSDESLRSGDISFSLSDELAKYFKEWSLRGKVTLASARISTPYFPLKTKIDTLGASFDNDNVTLGKFSLRSGGSDLFVDAGIDGIQRTLLGRGVIRLKADISSDCMDANEILGAYNKGSQYKPLAATDDISDDEYQKVVEKQAAEANPDSAALLIVPANLIADIGLNASNVKYSKLLIDTLFVKILARERCLQIDDFNAASSVGNIGLDAFYSTATRENVQAGFSLRLSEIAASDVIELIPAVDEAMPMLKGFSGLLDCSLAATTALDEHMNIKIPTMDGVLRIKGNNLTIKDSDEFTKIARLLMFKNHTQAVIDSLSVEGLVKNSRVEIFPFLLDVDRYDLALAGVQNVASNDFYYHVSILNSPLPAKFGVDLLGGVGKKSKVSVCKVKYKDVHSVPVFSDVVEESNINLLESIKNIFQKGVDKAVEENRANRSSLRRDRGFVPADEIRSESLDSESSAALSAAGVPSR